MKYTSALTHVAAAGIVTVLMLLVYVSVQQSYRSNANDPQLQLAKEIADKINEGKSFEKLLLPDTVDISKSLATFVCIYNAAGTAVQSTGLLNRQLPELPRGVLDYAKANKEDVLTWQPQNAVRVALVVETANSKDAAFVAVGRSLIPAEDRIARLGNICLIAWLACLGAIVAHAVLQERLVKKEKINS